MAITLGHLDEADEEILAFEAVTRLDPDNFGLRAGVNLSICNFLRGDMSEAERHLSEARK